MTEVISRPDVGASVDNQSAPEESFRGRLRRTLSEGWHALDLSAGAAVAGIDARAHAETMAVLNERYNGLIERRMADDRVSMALQSDIELDFRRDAQRAGFTDVNTIPTDQRRGIAEGAAFSYLDEIIAELQGHHLGWSAEDVEALAQQYAQDIVELLTMGAEDRDACQAAMFEYLEHGTQRAAAEAEQAELRAQRDERLRSFGRVALQTLVAAAQGVRNAPYTIGAYASVKVTQVREWYGNRSAEGKRTVWFSAAGVAIAGLVGYMTSRHSGMPGHYNLANFTDPLGGHPSGAGGGINHPTGAGGGFNHPSGFGGNVAHPSGAGGGVDHGTSFGGNVNHPSGAGGGINHPSGAGSANHPSGAGSNHPNGAGNNPNVIQNQNTLPIHTSHDLFTSTDTIDKWPTTITVSHWNSQTHDGSAWGISEQILRRSGIDNPGKDQIQHLENALLPQAQPNGYLLDGQSLNLQPALDALAQLSK